MNIPSDLSYSESHEWVKFDGDSAVVGITDYAQDELGDIIFVEFPQVDQQVTRGKPFGTVEAVKTVADLVAPLTGKVTDINEHLNDAPEKVNRDPYGDGWIVKIEASDPSEKETLLSADAYVEIIQ